MTVNNYTLIIIRVIDFVKKFNLFDKKRER